MPSACCGSNWVAGERSFASINPARGEAIAQEGDGEVQEMIDIADFAVGPSRMLYGNTMHSERPHHRLYEQWHSLGLVGVITAFNFPAAVWAWNAFIAAMAGDTPCFPVVVFRRWQVLKR